MLYRVLLVTLLFGWIATDLPAQPAHWYPHHPHMPSPYPYPGPYPHPYPYQPPWNPTVAQTHNHFSGFHYDPSTGRWTVDTTQSKVKESAIDPNRAHVDPGSWRRVNRWEGNTHVTGSRWTSYGVPHSNLQYHTVGPSAIPGINHGQTTNVFRSTGPGENGPSNQAGPTGRGGGAKELLKKWDTNANGSLDHEELGRGLKALNSSE
ncbi:MAG: hypothetical protein GY768_30935 [Planctomycetaceae bacterium]|nr:hypothetical protein [Planctomycetaceae bacterium]